MPVLVRGVTDEATTSALDWVSRSLLFVSSFDSLTMRLAALAALLGRFFAVGIFRSLLSFDDPASADYFFAGLQIVKYRCLSRRDRTLRFVEHDACLCLG